MEHLITLVNYPSENFVFRCEKVWICRAVKFMLTLKISKKLKITIEIHLSNDHTCETFFSFIFLFKITTTTFHVFYLY